MQPIGTLAERRAAAARARSTRHPAPVPSMGIGAALLRGAVVAVVVAGIWLALILFFI